MSYHPLIAFFIEQGVPEQTVLLLLMLPLIATLVAFFRQVIGIKAFGIYTPSIITFALLAFDPNGIIRARFHKECTRWPATQSANPLPRSRRRAC